MILHAIIYKKPIFKTKYQALMKAREMFPKEHPKGFVRETNESFRVRIVPKTKFDSTAYVSKKKIKKIKLYRTIKNDLKN